jgi:FlaA1/EpsC-like NDP-sugar epimerase
VEHCARAGLQTHVIPQLDKIVDGRLEVKVRDVTISDLLRRDPAQLDMAGIRDYIADRRVLVTGGAGSIGSELCRQLLAFGPASLVLVDQSEFGVFSMQQELEGREELHDLLRLVVADVCDEEAMYQVLDQHRPEVVFHAAAYKHVPLMEDHPQEAIRNNVLGTKTILDLADHFGVEDFVLISTDKAVRPTSVMGATKLIAEKYLQGKSATSRTKMITVRFGNVLNSAGSVVPTFRRQIEAGGPITVTHPDIERYFMTIPEAVQLVLQAGAVGSTGEVLILEMGQPVRIVDLAKDMIHLSGLRYPDDIDITFTGLRPGEKLYEELFYDSEQGARRIRDKIYCAKREDTPFIEINNNVSYLASSARIGKREACSALWEVVAHYVADATTPAAPVLRMKAAA